MARNLSLERSGTILMKDYELTVNGTQVILTATRCITFSDTPARLRFEIEQSGFFVCSIELWGKWEFTLGSPDIVE
jgi:hypothetical protein